MYSIRKRFAGLTLSLAIGGTCLQIGGCGPGAVINLLAGINPCGVILACDPAAFDFVTSGITGPGLDINVDPFCVFPPFCPGDVDPIFGNIGP